MTQYIVRRLLLLLLVVFTVYTMIFLFIRVVPGDIVDIFMEEVAGTGTAEVVAEQLRAELGLDKPIYQQYFISVGKLFRGDLGTSFRHGKPVTDELFRRAPITLELAALAFFIASLIAIPAGVIAALRQDKLPDYAARVGAVIFLAVPNFWLATMLIVFPAIWWNYSSPVLYRSPFEDLASNLRQMLPAAFVLGSAYAGVLARFIRSSLLEVMRQDYIRTARAKGLVERKVILVHAAKNAMVPVITMAGLQFSILLGGSIITENIFNIPGLGNLMVGSILNRDYAQLQANVLFFAAVVVLANLLVDMAYSWLDPRIQLG